MSSGEDLIRARFFLGGVVREPLERGSHGDGLVRRLAQRMSTATKKRIAVSKLYEAAWLYEAFHGDFATVEQLRGRLAFPLTYSLLLRECLPVLTRHDAWNPEQWLYAEQSTLSRLKQSVLEIEQRFLAADQSLVSGGEGGSSNGDESFRIVCSESQGYQEFAVRTVLRRLTDYVGFLERKEAVLSVPQQDQTLELARRIEALSARIRSSLESAGSPGAAA